MWWYALGCSMVIVGILLMLYSLCRISASADRHIEYWEEYDE